MLLRYVLVFLITSAFAIGQTQMEVPGGTWGPWSRLTTAGTGMETRVKCEYNVQNDSMWSYQFKNVTGHPVDVVEKEQHGLANSRINGFGAASTFTLGAGQTSYPYEGTMHGTCEQIHNLKIEFVCVVPHGSNSPCLMSGAGSPVNMKEQSGAKRHETTITAEKPVERLPESAPPVEPSIYAWCDISTSDQRGLFVTEVFQYSKEKEASLASWMSANHSGDAILGSLECNPSGSQMEAQTMLDRRLEQWRSAQAIIQQVGWRP